MKYKKQVVALIIISTLLRLLTAGGIELSNDEVYYWTYAHYLQWNYFDHPPVIALMIRFFTANFSLQQEIFLRLGPIVCAAINTWLIYLLGKKMKDELTGWIAACLFTASIYSGILAGLMLLPDAPQMVFWLGALLLITDIFNNNIGTSKRNARLLLFGLVAGLCIMSKIHGVFLWVGVSAYILLYDRKMFTNPYLYFSLLITAVTIFPIVWWNIINHFVTWNYHGDRVGLFNGAIQWNSFFRQLIGEVLYNNPVNVVIIVMALFTIRSKRWMNELYQQRLLLLSAIPLIATVWLMSLFKDTLPHWTGPAYTSLIPFAALFIRDKLIKKERVPAMPAIIKTAICIPLIVIATLVFSIHYLSCQIGSNDKQDLGSGDLLLDCSGWKTFAGDFNKLYYQDKTSGLINEKVTIVSDYWFPAAHLDYYVARPAGLNFLAIGTINNIHNYAWLNTHRLSLKPGEDAYYITVSNYFDAPSQALISSFEKNDPPVIISQYRGNALVRNFLIYRLKGYKSGVPASGLLY